mgnify:CR=1 FL=1
MLYYLTDNLLVDETHPAYQHILQAIKRLGFAAIESNHLVTGDYEILKKTLEWFRDDELLALFSGLVSNYATQAVPSFITYYLEVVLDNPVVRTVDGITIAQILPCDLCRTENVVSGSLIVEDINDAVFYDHILNWYVQNNRIKANFNYTKIHGGGNRIVDVIRQELAKKHISMTVIDTDKRYPLYNVNVGTYKDCKKLGRKAVYYKFLPLDVHEIENLLPLNYIDLLDCWTTETGRVKKKLFDYLKADAEHILPYFDIKKGIIKNNIKNDEGYFNFAKDCYHLNPEFVAIEPDFNTYCINKKDKEFIYEGLINGIMKKILEKIDDNSFPAPLLYDFQKRNWNAIGANMANWFVARNLESLY